LLSKKVKLFLPGMKKWMENNNIKEYIILYLLIDYAIKLC